MQAVREHKPLRVGNIPDFWFRVRTSPNRLLALDYDGTLAPFHVDPMQALPLPGTRDALFELGKIPGNSVAIISGRPVHEISTLLGDIRIPLIGCHGFEVMDLHGRITVKSPEAKQLEGMEKAAQWAVWSTFKGKIETKVASVAFHTRGMPRDEASKVEERLFKQCSKLGYFDLRCRYFNGGVEVYCTGRNKGDALGDLISSQPEGTLPVYIGDDTTDEDAFQMLRGIGIGIKVGHPSSGSAATGFLPDCERVSALLRSWLLITRQG